MSLKKGLDMRDADDAGQQLVFCNSYHLLLQPGPEIIEGKSFFPHHLIYSMDSLGSNVWPGHRSIVHNIAIDSMQKQIVIWSMSL